MEENRTALFLGWPGYRSCRKVTTDSDHGSQVAGVSMVTLSGDRTQLTLTEVQREVDGWTVLCTAFGSPQEVDSNPATITVQCRYIIYCNET